MKSNPLFEFYLNGGLRFVAMSSCSKWFVVAMIYICCHEKLLMSLMRGSQHFIGEVLFLKLKGFVHLMCMLIQIQCTCKRVYIRQLDKHLTRMSSMLHHGEESRSSLR